MAEREPRNKRLEADINKTAVSEVERRLFLVDEQYNPLRLTPNGVVRDTGFSKWRTELSDIPRKGDYIIQRASKSSKERTVFLEVVRVEHEPTALKSRPANIYIVVRFEG